jgi:hypothetical protein
MHVVYNNLLLAGDGGSKESGEEKVQVLLVVWRSSRAAAE